jgi:hypothetical protein
MGFSPTLRSMTAMRLFAPLLALTLCLSFLGAEETYDQMVKKTDQSNPEAVYALAKWCQDHNLPSKARQHLFQVIKLDKDHAEARNDLGQVKVGERWVAKTQVKDQGKDPAKSGEAGKGGATGAEHNAPVGKAPCATEVGWDLTVPKDPKPNNTFVNSYIERMSKVGNDSTEMEVSVSTLLTDDNLPTALPRVCAALLKPEFTDLYGPCDLVQGLLKQGRRRDAQLLFGFVATASSRSTDSEDLQAFAFAASAVRDKRAMPRLIELMASDKSEVVDAATEAAAVITGVSRAELTPDRAKTWWAKFWRADELTIMKSQLNSKDPETSIHAATVLCAAQEKKALDVLIEWLKSDDPKVATKAHLQVALVTGRDWAYVPTDSLEQRLQRVEVLTKWWKENRETFKLIVPAKPEVVAVDDQPAAAAGDPLVDAVRDLGAVDGKVAAKGEAQLIDHGTAAVPALIDGLRSDNPIIARKAHELLQRVSRKSDIAFNPRDPEATKRSAIAAWTAWADSQHLLKVAKDEEGDDKKEDDKKDDDKKGM